MRGGTYSTLLLGACPYSPSSKSATLLRPRRHESLPILSTLSIYSVQTLHDGIAFVSCGVMSAICTNMSVRHITMRRIQFYIIFLKVRIVKHLHCVKWMSEC